MNSFLKIMFISCFLISQLSPPRALAVGGISSNGGDGVVSEFFAIARSLQKMLQQTHEKRIDLPLFSKTIQNAKIYSKKQVFLHGQEVGAINTPKLQEIHISRKHWKTLKENPRLKYVLVLHEFLGLMGVEDRTFSISNKILEGPGLIINQVSCPFIHGSSLENAESYSLELFKYHVENFNMYRAVVYVNGLPDDNSETISAQRMRFSNKNSSDNSIDIQAEIGTTGSSRIMSDNPLSDGLIIHFEVWPGTPTYGYSLIQNNDPAEKVNFKCNGHIL